MLKKNTVIPFYFFSDRSLEYGGYISGKKFFSMCDLFCSGHNNLETIFQFRITKATYPPSFYGKIKKWVPYPLYFFLLLTFFFPFEGSSPHIKVYNPCVALLVAFALQLLAKFFKIPPRRLAIFSYSFLIFYMHASNNPLILNAFETSSVVAPTFPSD